jgi:hypothetical protein
MRGLQLWQKRIGVRSYRISKLHHSVSPDVDDVVVPGVALQVGQEEGAQVALRKKLVSGDTEFSFGK